MIFPEFLYQLSGRDQQVTWLDPQLLRAQIAAAAASVNAPIAAVPTGRILLLTSVSVFASPGAAQNVADGGLAIEALTPVSGAVIRLASITGALAANLQQTLNWVGQVLIPPGWIINGLGNFNAGAVANTVTLDVTGILMPVGNIQRV